MCAKPVLFATAEGDAPMHGIDADDMVQGAVGNAWFVGAVSCISLLPELVMDIFVDDDEYSQPIGAYKVKFYKKNTWVEVLIDDRLPCYPDGRPLYGRGKNANEIWPMLLEKAYAKLHGCYENLIGGRMTYALQDLTGGAPQTIPIDPDDALLLLQMQSWAAKDTSLMGCASAHSAGIKPAVLQGIAPGHAYGVVDVKTVSGLKLVCVRNPWGDTEWRGDWSDDSPLWEKHPEVQKACKQRDGNDGTFWMSWDDFNDVFTSLYVVHMFPKSWQVQHFSGMWTAEFSGGCCKHSTWTKNPQFAIHVEKKDTMLYVTISQDDMRMKQVCATVCARSSWTIASCGMDRSVSTRARSACARRAAPCKPLSRASLLGSAGRQVEQVCEQNRLHHRQARRDQDWLRAQGQRLCWQRTAVHGRAGRIDGQGACAQTRCVLSGFGDTCSCARAADPGPTDQARCAAGALAHDV
jgi:hypothetical protein